MANNDVTLRLTKILANQLKVKEESILLDSRLAEELGADSLDTAEIAMMIKDEFGYDLPDDAILKIKTVNDLVVAVSSGVSPKI